MKCGFRKCNNIFLDKPRKLYCSRKCKDSEKHYRKRDQIENRDTRDMWSEMSISPGSRFPEFVKEKIIIHISYRNVTHYLKLGYNATINENLEIQTKDLPSSSHIRLDVICQRCGSITNLRFHKYISNKERGGIYTCRRCRTEKVESLATIFKSEELYEDISNKNYKLYKNEVRRLSKKSVKTLYTNWNGYDFYDNEYIKEYLNLSHVDNRYPSVDHKISIYYGFINNIPPKEIANISNLCITKRFINSSKRDLISY